MEHCFNIIDHKNGAAHTSAHSIPSQVMIMSKKIAVIGECMIELSEKKRGGKPADLAAIP